MQIPQNNLLFLIFAGLAFLNLILFIILFWQFEAYRRIQKELISGEEKANLEEIVLKHKKLIASHNKNIKELTRFLEHLLEESKASIQKVGVIRFNPFADTGGNMSFAIALLDGRKNGIVISSLHSREGTRIYAKSIKNGASEHHLTEEEKEAIKQANDNR